MYSTSHPYLWRFWCFYIPLHVSVCTLAFSLCVHAMRNKPKEEGMYFAECILLFTYRSLYSHLPKSVVEQYVKLCATCHSFHVLSCRARCCDAFCHEDRELWAQLHVHGNICA